MTLTVALFALSSLAFVVFLARSTFATKHTGPTGAWAIPAVLSLAFFLYSGYTIWLEGPLGFFVDHTRTLWGIQIWFDLLMGVSIAWLFMVPQARKHHMNIAFWMVFVIATGNVGLMAMLARLLWLHESSEELPHAPMTAN